MNDLFKIYIEQLRDGHIEAITECFPPDFLEIEEEDLAFNDPVKVQGEAYLAEDNLVLHLNIATLAEIPCSICNSPVKVPITINGFYYAVPLEEIKSGVYNYKEILRETVLLETPPLAECREGNCPQRPAIDKYLKHDSKEPSGEEGYHPFADLDLNE